jgi:hypothetical protein
MAKDKKYERGKNVLSLKQKPCFHPSTLRSSDEGFAENGRAAVEQMALMKADCDRICTKCVCLEAELRHPLLIHPLFSNRQSCDIVIIFATVLLVCNNE